MAFIPPEQDDYEIMMTPFIDCVFLLLVYFLAATSFYKIEKDITIKLPEASEANSNPTQTNEVIVNVRKSGVFVIKGRVLELSDLEKLLSDATRGGQKPAVTIRGDQDALHLDVVKVMNACVKVGISGVSVATFRPPQAGQSTP